MNIAKQAATRASCDRAHVGCVIVVDQQIVATGYNGAIAGAPSCDDAGHFLEDGHCVRTNHAEVNAIAQAARHGHATEQGTAYITHRPCLPCARALCAAGIRSIVYDIEYGPAPDYSPLYAEHYLARGKSTGDLMIRIKQIPQKI